MNASNFYRAAFIVACIALAIILSGCASINTRTLDSADRLTHTETRVYCSLQRDEASIISRWGFFAFAFDLSQRDAPTVCAPPIMSPSVDILLPDLTSIQPGAKAR